MLLHALFAAVRGSLFDEEDSPVSRDGRNFNGPMGPPAISTNTWELGGFPAHEVATCVRVGAIPAVTVSYCQGSGSSSIPAGCVVAAAPLPGSWSGVPIRRGVPEDVRRRGLLSPGM